MDPERCAPFGVGPGSGPYAAAGNEPPGAQATPAAAPHLHPAPPRGPRLTRFPACGPLEPYLPEPAKPPAKYLQDLGPAPALNGGHFYEGPEEGKAQPDPLPFPPRPGPASPLPSPARLFLKFVTLSPRAGPGRAKAGAVREAEPRLPSAAGMEGGRSREGEAATARCPVGAWKENSRLAAVALERPPTKNRGPGPRPRSHTEPLAPMRGDKRSFFVCLASDAGPKAEPRPKMSKPGSAEG